MKRACRSSARFAFALTAIASAASATAQGRADWFGPACETVDAAAPVAERLLLLSARQRPDTEGDDIRALQTADGALWASQAQFESWRLPLPAQSMERRGRRWYPLAAVQSLRYRFDDCTQALWIDVASASTGSGNYDLDRLGPQRPQPSAISPGGYLNLDLQYQDTDVDRGELSGIAELGIFSRWGYGASSMFSRDDEVVRLDSSWTQDNPDRLERLTIGDSILRPSQFGLPVRFGGLQFGTAFDLRPDIVTFPRPTLQGQAALPSSVEVYVNQSLRARQDVPAGPFEISNIPAMVGLDRVQLVTTDVLGRQQVTSFPLYSSQSLLTAGLSDYTVEAGWLRQDYGLRSARYRDVAGSGTWRRGLSNTMTVELRGEGSSEHALVSAGGDFLLPKIGVLSAGYAHSQSHGRGGSSATLGFQRVTSGLSFSLQAYRAEADFVRTGEEDNLLRASDLAGVGFSLGRYGSVSMTHLRQRREQAGSSVIDSLGYNVVLVRDLFAGLTFSQLHEPEDDHLAMLFLTWRFGWNHNAYANAQRARDGSQRQQFSVQKNIGGLLGHGYQASVDTGDDSRQRVLGEWSTRRGSLVAEGVHDEDRGGYRLSYNTGIALLGSEAFWTRPVRGGFAVVDTSGVAGITVFADEHAIGKTDASGHLLLPDLRAYEENRVRIDELDVPLAAALETTARSVLLPTRGGTRVSFPVKQGRSLRLRLHLADGTPVPAGASTLVDSEPGLPVGFNGSVYLETAPETREIQVRWKRHRCSASWPAGLASARQIDLLCRQGGEGQEPLRRFQLSTTLSVPPPALSAPEKLP